MTQPTDGTSRLQALIDEMRSAVTLSAQFDVPVIDRQGLSEWANQLEALAQALAASPEGWQPIATFPRGRCIEIRKLRAEVQRLTEENINLRATKDYADIWREKCASEDRAEAAESQVITLRDALETFGTHKPLCDSAHIEGCDCGFKTALAPPQAPPT